MKTIGVREFLRGGYQEVDTPTVVMSHSRPVGIWMPYDASKEPIKIMVSSPKPRNLTKEK
jgi:hypothetical protein